MVSKSKKVKKSNSIKKKLVKNNSNSKVIGVEPVVKNVVENQPVKSDYKEEIKSSKIDWKFTLITILVIIIALFVAIVYIYPIFANPYRFTFALDGVTYKSNEYVPAEFFQIVKNSENIVVSPMILGTEVNQPIVNTINLWLVAGVGNGKNMIQLLRIVDEKSNLVSCYTNDGNYTSVRQLNVTECNQMLSNENYTFILIESGKNEVILEKNKMRILSLQDNLQELNYSIINTIFPNAKELYDYANQSIYSVG
ncbi:MAG: hypothetical protein PHQ98_00830 [Candidatus ainarchaeum sp.]|nr:hypothetical protein [Candidatus ainarchaeum sp.]